MATPEVTDLTSATPATWTVQGLSAPQSDGKNMYRTPLPGGSTVTFPTAAPVFAQLELQLYDPHAQPTAQVRVDGEVIGTVTFPAGRFGSVGRAGQYLDAGTHTFSVTYRCSPAPCQPRQYGTEVVLLPTGAGPARQPVGLGVERWTGGGPGSPLRFTDMAPLQFDGANILRPVPGPSFQVAWPDRTPLNASFRFYSAQPARVSAEVDHVTVATARGDGKGALQLDVSLAAHPHARAVTLRIECSGVVTTGCASLLAAQVAVRTSPPVTPGLLGTAGVSALLLLGVAWRLLRPTMPSSPPAPTIAPRSEDWGGR